MIKPELVGDRDLYFYDSGAVDLVLAFFEAFLTHIKGSKAGDPFVLDDWQIYDIIAPLFGVKRIDNDTRRYRQAYIEIPRKNGKSTLAAGIALYMLFADREPGAEIYSAAADREQAGIVFDLAKEMIERSPSLRDRCEVYKRSIVIPETMSTYRVLSSEAFTKEGLNPHGVIFDELHAQPNRLLYDTLDTATGARAQPLFISITTAGESKLTICGELHDYGSGILGGDIVDDSFFAYIAAANDNDPWEDPGTWAKANPGLGVSLRPDYLEQKAARAKAIPAYVATFKRYHLNIWTSTVTRWLDPESWDLCERKIDWALYKGATGYMGLDLSSVTDLTAAVITFPSEDDRELYTWLPFFWIPEEGLAERQKTSGVVGFAAWVDQGYIRVTPGNAIDYGFIVRDLEAMQEEYNIKIISFDRWGAFQVSQNLERIGYEVLGFGQGFKSMSPPSKELERLILSQQIIHDGNPVLRWNVTNAVAQIDPAGNIKPDKKKSKEKIDGLIAGIMGLDTAIRETNQERGDSPYKTRGVVSL